MGRYVAGTQSGGHRKGVGTAEQSSRERQSEFFKHPND